MNMCLCQLEGGVKRLRTGEGYKNLVLGEELPIWGGGCTFAGGIRTPLQAMTDNFSETSKPLY